MPETLRPRERIKKQKDFIALYKKGKRYKGKYFILIYCPNEFNFSRFAVVASKKTGDAIKRNRIKRRIRVLFRQNKHLLIISMDLIVIAKAEIYNSPWMELQEEYLKAIRIIIQKHR
ncbi:MAG: ribonuclease P protein component [Candidatus Aminicenantes bacterium]|nr:ribonuclease P protein component [Candidatus Aminicenantes bacterium]